MRPNVHFAQLLEARLPELSWRLGQLKPFIKASILPRGLFKKKGVLTPEDCIQEIQHVGVGQFWFMLLDLNQY